MKKLMVLLMVLSIAHIKASGTEVLVINPKERALVVVPTLRITPAEIFRVRVNTLMIKALARHTQVDVTRLAITLSTVTSFSAAVVPLLARTSYAQEARIRVDNLPQIKTDLPLNPIEIAAYEKIVNDELDRIFAHDTTLAADLKKLCAEYDVH